MTFSGDIVWFGVRWWCFFLAGKGVAAGRMDIHCCEDFWRSSAGGDDLESEMVDELECIGMRVWWLEGQLWSGCYGAWTRGVEWELTGIASVVAEKLTLLNVEAPFYLMQDDTSLAWWKHKKHFFILNNAGKPIYSRFVYECELLSKNNIRYFMSSKWNPSSCH